MTVLNAAKAEFAKRGYQTQTVRIVTQPLAELVKGLGEARGAGIPEGVRRTVREEGLRAECRPGHAA